MLDSVANFIRQRFPLIHHLASGLYYKTPHYKQLAIKQSQRKKKEQQIVHAKYGKHPRIQSGPFKGMVFLTYASSGAYTPKVLGIYEHPIQHWMQKAIEDNKYKQIINIGTAEGYYTCGLALKFPQAEVEGFDTSEVARAECSQLIELNKLRNIKVHSTCTPAVLSTTIKPDCFIVCDVEGYEKTLLNPLLVPELSTTDMIIELHDFILGNGEITETLLKRFNKSHKIEIIVDYPLPQKNLPNKFSEENRAGLSRWMRLTHLV